MTNLDDQLTIHAYLDRQLDTEARTACENRLSHEAALLAALESEQHFRVGLRNRLRQTRAPASLRATIEANLAASSHPAAPTWWERLWTWLATPRPVAPLTAAAYTLVLLVLFSAGTLWLNRPGLLPVDHTVYQKVAGMHRVSFDREDLTQGVYFYSIKAGDKSETHKMIFAK